ncbi:MAG: hypothetical protein KGM15_11910 [Pseudomonadota bacterium]|nr:hypothetical protein [Pseudomonadota bacterium]
MTAPNFGKRGVAPGPPRRLRSNAVTIGVVGALGLGLSGALAYQEYHCWPPRKGEPDTRPGWCFHHGSYYGGGHGWGFGSGVGGVGHASFGGFGAHGAGHGGGS